MVSCLGKIHNLPRTIKTISELAGCVFFFLFPLLFNFIYPPRPRCLLRGSVGHTITPTVCLFFTAFLTTVENFCILVHLGSNSSITSKTGLVNKSHSTQRGARLLDTVLVTCSPARLEMRLWQLQGVQTDLIPLFCNLRRNKKLNVSITFFLA